MDTSAWASADPDRTGGGANRAAAGREALDSNAEWRRVANFEDVPAETRYVPDPHDHLKRFWQGNLRPALNELGKIRQTEGGVERFTLPLFEGEEAVVSVRQFDAMAADAGVFTGEIAGEPGSFVTLAYVDSAEAGSIHLPSRNQVFEIRAGPDRTVILGEVDVTALGECDLRHDGAGEQAEPLPE